jgi:hypothetical protein
MDAKQTNKLKHDSFGVGFIIVENILINKYNLVEPDL